MHTLHHLSRAIEWVPNVNMPAIRRFYYYSSSMPKMEVVTLLAFSIVHVEVDLDVDDDVDFCIEDSLNNEIDFPQVLYSMLIYT